MSPYNIHGVRAKPVQKWDNGSVECTWWEYCLPIHPKKSQSLLITFHGVTQQCKAHNRILLNITQQTVPLRAGGFLQGSDHVHLIRKYACLCDHPAIVDAIPNETKHMEIRQVRHWQNNSNLFEWVACGQWNYPKKQPGMVLFSIKLTHSVYTIHHTLYTVHHYYLWSMAQRLAPLSWAMLCIISCRRTLQPTPPTINTVSAPVCAIALSVISTNIANTVSCTESLCMCVWVVCYE